MVKVVLLRFDLHINPEEWNRNCFECLDTSGLGLLLLLFSVPEDSWFIECLLSRPSVSVVYGSLLLLLRASIHHEVLHV